MFIYYSIDLKNIYFAFIICPSEMHQIDWALALLKVTFCVDSHKVHM